MDKYFVRTLAIAKKVHGEKMGQIVIVESIKTRDCMIRLCGVFY